MESRVIKIMALLITLIVVLSITIGSVDIDSASIKAYMMEDLSWKNWHYWILVVIVLSCGK